MAKERLGYEPYAWWLIREQLGLCLRKRYPVYRLPPRLLTLVRKLETADDTQLSQTFGGELDATEDSSSREKRLRV